MRIAKRVGQGEMVPRFYGLVYRDYERCEAVCAPVPLNIALRYVRHVWWWAKFRYASDEHARLVTENERLRQTRARLVIENEDLKERVSKYESIAQILSATREARKHLEGLYE